MYKSLLKNNLKSTIQIVNKEVEGQFYLKYAEPLQQIRYYIFFNILITIFTLGLLPLFMFWSQDLKKKLIFRKNTNLSQCTHVLVIHTDKSKEIVKIKSNLSYSNKYLRKSQQKTLYIETKFLKYEFIGDYLDINSCSLQATDFLCPEWKTIDILNMKPNNQQDITTLQKQYGTSELKIPLPSFLKFMVKQLISPLLFFQYFGSIIYFLINQPILCFTLLIFSIIMIILNYLIIRLNLKKINQLNQIRTQTICERIIDDILIQIRINQDEILPGDIIYLQNNIEIPCDGVMIQGEAVINESMLTGESTPVNKQSLQITQEKFCFFSHSKSVLRQGTNIIFLKSGQAKMMVLRTSFCTLKGQLIRTMLFPIELKDHFIKDSFKFYFYFGLVCYIVYIPAMFVVYSNGLSQQQVILKFLNSILWIIPPALPIFFAWNNVFALIRLYKKKIIGIFPEKIVKAGEINVCCFDKTGTMTKNDINLYGIMKSEQFGEVQSQKTLNKSDIFGQIMGFCHNIVVSEGQLLGDILDIQMLNSSPFIPNSSELEIKEIFQFESQLQRMSVFVQNKYDLFVFTKGSPEIIKEICVKSSIPKYFDQILNNYTIKGYRIIALAYKQIQEQQQITRDIAEIDLQFQGFLIFENPLKHDTSSVIKKLEDAGIQTKIISGDNIFTSIEVGIQSNVIKPNDEVCIIDYIKSSGTASLKFLFQGQIINNITLQSNSSRSQLTYDLIEDIYEEIYCYQKANKKQLILAINGNFFNDLHQQLKNQVLQNRFDPDYQLNDLDKIINKYKQILLKCKVFGRISPHQKSQIIQELQNCNLSVCMTGDGANDCSAIKQANVGISFCESQASLSAPFSSLGVSISCVIDVLQNGQTSNFEIFQYIIFSSAARFSITIIIQLCGYWFSDIQWTILSFLGMFHSLVLMGNATPLNNLSNKLPIQSIFEKAVVFNIIQENILVAISFIAIFLLSFYQGILDKFDFNEIQKTEGTLNSIMFFMIWIWQNIFAFIIYQTKPFKKSIFYNIYFMIDAIICFICITILFLKNDQDTFFNLTPLSISIRIQMLAIIAFTALIMYVCEIFIRNYYHFNIELQGYNFFKYLNGSLVNEYNQKSKNIRKISL